MELRKISAFIKKEFIVETSYKFAFLLHVFGLLSWILIFYFIDRLFGNRITPHLEPYGVNYFSYVLLGIAFFTYAGTGMTSFASHIRNEQLTGTLEALLATPTKVSSIVFSMGIWNFIWASVSVFIYLVFGIALFGVDLSNINLLSSLLILVLTIISFSGLGLVAASFIMILKRGQPVTWVVNTLFQLLGGVYFPISIFPSWIKIISYLLPITYSIRAMQLAVYKNYSITALKSDLAGLIIFSLIFFPLGLILFNRAVKKAKMDGSLTHF